MKIANCVYDTKHLIVTNMHDCHLFWMKWMAIKHFWCIWGYFIVTIRVIWKENPFKCHFVSNVFIYNYTYIYFLNFVLFIAYVLWNKTDVANFTYCSIHYYNKRIKSTNKMIIRQNYMSIKNFEWYSNHFWNWNYKQ